MRRARRAILLMALAAPLWAWPNGYNFRRSITVNSGQTPSAQSGFPMLFAGTYGYLATTGNGGKVRNAVTSGTDTAPADLIFTNDAAGASLLQWEVESYNPATGAIVAWVRWNSIFDGATIYLFYGNPAVTTPQSTPSAVWDANYKGVLHFPDGTNLSVADSTGTLTTTNHGATATDGVSDGALAASGGPYADLGTTVYGLGIRQSATFSGWVRPRSTSYNHTMLGDWNNYAGMALRVDEGNASATFYVYPADQDNLRLNPSYNFQMNTWYYLAGVMDGATMLLYINGSQAASGSLGEDIGNSGADLLVGNRGDLALPAYADFDEVRISNTARSADWIATEYNSESAPGNFYSVGAEQSATSGGSGFPVIL
jgi:hypothetical protein